MSAPARKDPMAAFFLTVFIPGLGHLYLGRVAVGLLIAAVVFGLYFASGGEGPLFMLGLFAHVAAAFQASSAAIRSGGPTPLPPPPPPSMTLGRVAGPAAASPPPVPVDATPPSPRTPPPPPLDADTFLAEIRRVWKEHRDGTIDAASFAAAKTAAIARVRVADIDEGEALLEAASELVAAGVLTPDERGRLQRKAAG